jgi:hypothetical protein
MFRRATLGAGLVLFALAGCRDLIAPKSDQAPPPAAGLRSGDEMPEDSFLEDSVPRELARPTFFLPPVASRPQPLPGVFDPEVSPAVEVCAWTGSACAGPPLARFTRESGAERVRVAEDSHYAVHWQLRDFSVQVGSIYRIRVLVNGLETAHRDVKVVRNEREAAGVNADQYLAAVENQTVPIRFYVQKVRRLVVIRMEDGVGGVPADQDTLYAYGTSVSWNFTPLPGFDSVSVWLDGEVVSTSGTLRMDRNHAMLLSAQRAVVLNPEDRPLVESARAILTATDKVAAFQVHLEQVAALYRRVGDDEARERIRAVELSAYDFERDREAIREAHRALGGHIFRIRQPEAAGSAAPAFSRAAASLQTSATSQPKTTFYSVNGVLNTPTGAASYAAEVQETIDETRLPNGEMLYVYNSSFLFSDKVKATECFSNLFDGPVVVAAILLVPRLATCFFLIGYDIVAALGDLQESAYQVSRLYADLPIPAIPDSYKLADSIRSGLRRSDQVILLPHSQGNLLTQEAMRYLKETNPALRAGGTACVGVVSLATPNSRHWPAVGMVDGIIQKRDIILALPYEQFEPVSTPLSRDNERKARRAYTNAKWASLATLGIGAIPAYLIAAGYDLALRGGMHSSIGSYLNERGARPLVKNALVRQYNGLPTLPGCAKVAAVEVSPATGTVMVGATTQLAATTRDAAGNVLTGRAVTWTSSDPSVATVSGTGLVTGAAPGAVTVTATSEGKSGTASVTVTGGAYLAGRVVHAETRSGISGATVTFSSSGGTRFVSTGGDGSYTSPGLAAGTYQVTVSAPGYVSVTLYGAVARSGQTTTLETIPLVPSSPHPGGISGSISDARHNGAIPGATVELRSGMNALEGAVVASTTADAAGNYRFTGLPAGTYSILARAPNFVDGVQTGVVVGNREIPGQNLSLSPATSDITIVLRWGATPSDLDSHLTGPTASGSRFHVYYAAKGSLTSSPYAALDIDDVSSYGPETITISRQLSGVYRYSVHDYTNRSTNPSSGLAGSGAQVKVYRGGALIGEFNVPNQPGTLWTVFELEGETIRAVNTLTYLSSPSSVQSRAPVLEGRRSGLSSSTPQTDAAVIEKAVQENPKP